MMRAEASDALIAEICEAALDSQAWQRVVDLAATELNNGCVGIIVRRDKSVPEFFAHAGYPGGAVEDFHAKHGVLCPWNEVYRDSRLGVPFAIEDVLPLASITYSKFYREWLVPHGLGAGFGVKFVDCTDCSASLVIHCAFEAAVALKPHCLEVLARLAPHLRRSAELSRRFATVRDEGVRAGLMRSTSATAVLDGNTTVLSMNPEMERVIGLGFCALSAGRKLRLSKPDDTARMSAILVEAVKGRRTLPWPHIMSIQVPGQTGPNVMEIEPLDQRTDGAFGSPGGVFEGNDGHAVFVITMRVRNLLRGPSLDHIRVGLGLTPKQAEAVWSLVNGESVEQQAQDRGVSVDGVRWHFKNIYQRTGCSSQAELVRLVVSLFSPAAP